MVGLSVAALLGPKLAVPSILLGLQVASGFPSTQLQPDPLGKPTVSRVVSRWKESVPPSESRK